MGKSAFPYYIQTAGDSPKKVPLANVPKTRGPFIVLHSHDEGFVVISFATQKIATLGRGDANDVKLGAESVSREHAAIRFEDGHFIIDDMGSTYGTLLAMNSNRPLQVFDREKPTSIQVGRTIFSFEFLRAGGGMMGEESLDMDDTCVIS